MALELEQKQLLYAVLLAPDERDALLRALRCVEDNWTLEPVEEQLIARLEGLEGRAVPVPIPSA
jgi:Trp operon repressor